MKRIYKILLTFVLVLTASFSLLAQNTFFSAIGESAITVPATAKRVIIPQKYATFSGDMAQLKTFLWGLPAEKNVANKNQAPVIKLPMPDGKFASFRVWESSIQEPGLEAKFPMIKTFAGQGIDDPYATIRLDYSPYGFHAQVLTINGSFYIDPYARGMADNYISYFRTDFRKMGTFLCEVPDNPVSPNAVTAACRGTQLITHRLAVACTGEYAQAPGISAGTNAAILHAAIVTTVNRVVGVYEKEVAVRMILVANNNLVEFLNAATDPFNGNNNANVLINESQVVIDANIGSANYDIGHTFSTGGGGLAQLSSVCGGSKARGITGSPNPTGDAYDIDYVAHEVGHQYGGNHSMAGCGSSPTSTKYEVGSGTTIQAYAGICGAENIQPNSDPYFHAISFDEISNFLAAGGGSCGTVTATGNNIPIIDALPNNNLNIPPSTPFTLTGTATDPDADPLTYNWEQWDFSGTATWNAGATAAPGNTVPLFKSRIPKATGSRTFPDMAVILAGYPANPPSAMNGLKGETLSPVARPMKFKLTVRDNRVTGGGVASAGAGGCQSTTIFQVNVVGSTPFTMSSPNGGESYAGGSTQTITWNVAGTDVAPISVANVKISLSTDGGLTYPTVVLASTPNDGSQSVTIPPGATTTARIKVEAVGNIFFDISNANFSITAPVNPTYEFVNPAPVSVACGTATAAITLQTNSLLGFTTPINLVATGMPGVTTVSYSVNPVTPGQSTVVTLNQVNTLAPGSYPITIQGTAGTELKSVILTYNVTPGAGPAITADPTAQILCTGGNTSFTVASAAATSFQWQVSTTGAGGPWNNISNGGVYSNATTATLNITGATAVMNGYQYRAVASVTCGSTNSAAALLTVQAAPSITTQPSASVVCGGTSSATFTVAASGTGLSYQWQVSLTGCGGPWVNLANGAPYSGVTTPTLTINPVTTAMNGYAYQVVVSGTCAPSVTSGCGLLTANTPVAVTTQPLASIICAGAGTSFTVAASGTTPGYQWQVSTTGAAGPWTNITNGGVYSGATTSTLTLAGVTAGMTGYLYRAVVNGAAPCGSVNSAEVALTVNTAPAITTSPVAATTLCAGNTVTYNVAATGTALTYQWQVSTTGAAGPWTNVIDGGVYSGATTTALTITGITAAMTGYQYRALVNGTCAPAATSGNAVVTVNTPISITTQPAATTNICATGSTSFTVAAAGTTPSYQWQISTTGAGGPWTNIANGGVYGGVTTNTLTLTGITAAMTGNQYRAVVSGAAPCTPVNSGIAVLNVTPQPVVTAPSTSLLAGQKTTLSVNVTPGPGLTFAWYRDGILVPGATSNTLEVTVNNLGSYKVIVTSGTGSCESALIAITATPSNKLFVFPSPNNGRFQVSYYTANASATSPTKQSISIYDSYGRLVHRNEYNVTQQYQLHNFDMRRNGMGVYYIVLREANGNKIKTGEVVVR
jgi:Metallo-peptidase family M12B Reprolysin-like/Secretion system C-terminal sorting domain